MKDKVIKTIAWKVHFLFKINIMNELELFTEELFPPTKEELEEILEKKDRTLAGPTASAKGLCLMNLDYGDFQSFLL